MTEQLTQIVETHTICHSLDELFQVMARADGIDYIGERVSQLQHALQSADYALRKNKPDWVVLAALFHDIGHMFDQDPQFVGALGSMRHEILGAEILRHLGFSEEISELVRGHVAAKRYLTFVDPRYRQRLSAASLGTLALQGGPMSSAEADDFKSHPLSADILFVRGCDEIAKEIDWHGPGLDHYRVMAANHIQAYHPTEG